MKELQRQGNPNIVIALAGNKSDLNSKRKVEPEEAESYASDNGIFFMETSAKTATNVNELIVAIGAPPRPARHPRRARHATTHRHAPHPPFADALLTRATSVHSPQAAEEHAAATARPAGRHRACAERRRGCQKGGLLLSPSLRGLCACCLLALRL